MIKRIISILLIFSSMFIAAFAGNEHFNTLVNMKFEAISNREVRLKIFTTNRYNQTIIPKKVNKYTYLITLPDTKSSMNPKSLFFQENRNVAVKTMSSGNEYAYTKIYVSMPVTVPLNLEFATTSTGRRDGLGSYQISAASVSTQPVTQKQPDIQRAISVISNTAKNQTQTLSTVQRTIPKPISNASIVLSEDNNNSKVGVSQSQSRQQNNYNASYYNDIQPKPNQTKESSNGITYLLVAILSVIAGGLYFYNKSGKDSGSSLENKNTNTTQKSTQKESQSLNPEDFVIKQNPPAETTSPQLITQAAPEIKTEDIPDLDTLFDEFMKNNNE